MIHFLRNDSNESLVDVEVVSHKSKVISTINYKLCHAHVNGIPDDETVDFYAGIELISNLSNLPPDKGTTVSQDDIVRFILTRFGQEWELDYVVD